MRTLTGRRGHYGQATRNYSTLPARMLSASTDTTNKMKELETQGSYYDQVTKARELWAVYGSNTAKYPDPIVSTVMDMMVYATVAFGTENLLKDVPPDHPAKEVLDHWCATVNSGNPMLTPGLDATRKQYHQGRWCDGGTVIAWSKPETVKTYSGVSYKAPKQMAVLPRPNFMVKSSEVFGGFELKYKDLSVAGTGIETDEVATDEKVGEIADFLAQKRYVVFDRGRMEAAQKFPVPYLVARGLTGICARIRQNQRGDYQTIGRVIKALLIITQGAKEWIDLLEWMPEDATSALAGLKSDVTDEGGGYSNVITGPYSTEAKWVMPDLQLLLSAEKYVHDDYERLAALGVLRLTETGENTRRYEFNPKPLVMEIWDAMQADRRLIEGRIFPILYENNPKIFKDIQPANFHQKPVTIFMSEAEKQILLQLYEYGIMTVGSLLEQTVGFGADVEAEANRKKYEEEQGYEEIFKAPVMFTQSVRRDVTERETKEVKETEEEIAAARRPVTLPDRLDDLKSQVLDIVQSDETDARKKSAIRALLASMIAAWGMDLRARLLDYYVRQFPAVDVAEYINKFEPYVASMQDKLDGFANDLLSGGASGTKGILPLLDASATPEQIASVFDTNRARLSLYEREPFKVARLSGEAAKAQGAGKRYAVRHSAFAKTTCQECIRLHGKIYPIEVLFAGEVDHPNGLCWFSYHTDRAEAAIEASEMLTIDEINKIVNTMEEYDDAD